MWWENHLNTFKLVRTDPWTDRAPSPSPRGAETRRLQDPQGSDRSTTAAAAQPRSSLRAKPLVKPLGVWDTPNPAVKGRGQLIVFPLEK